MGAPVPRRSTGTRAVRPPPAIRVPDSGRQIFVAAFLARTRQTGLHAAVAAAARAVDSAVLRNEIARYASADGLTALQGTGVRDEEVFATPEVLRKAPGALAYYRLLLGISQKQFYSTATGLNAFKSMEDRQVIGGAAAGLLPDLCTALNAAAARMLHVLPAQTLRLDVDQLPLLTLGAQADGSWRTQIGTRATKDVFDALKKIVRTTSSTFTETEVSITVTNSSHREVTLMLAPDPDIVIREQYDGTTVYKAAIEIKGGKDYANIHNRVGEAEKSHQKARQDGAADCWTVIHMAHANPDKLKRESPATRVWIDMGDVLAGSGSSWDKLVRLTKTTMGI
ncbi:MAG TPA: XcyI family restriction endonuclease [Rhodanobacteraceae bacterium]